MKTFPDPVDVAKIAALLRNNEGYHDLIDEAYELLVKADDYCRAQQNKNPDEEEQGLLIDLQKKEKFYTLYHFCYNDLYLFTLVV